MLYFVHVLIFFTNFVVISGFLITPPTHYISTLGLVPDHNDQNFESCTSPTVESNLATKLIQGSALEIFYASKLHFGNFLNQVPGKSSLKVQLSTGEHKVIDVGQIVNIWSTIDGHTPSSTAEWWIIEEESRSLLHRLPARGLDLTSLWQFARDQGGGFTVTSIQAADFLFNCPISARKGYIFQETQWAPTPAQIAAAAMALAADEHRFKRKVSQLSAQQQEDCLCIGVGGYRALAKATVTSREAISFAKLIQPTQQTTNKMDTTASVHVSLDSSQLQIVHELEVVALGGTQSLSSGAKQAFRHLGKEITAQAARDVLIELGHWSKDISPSESPHQKVQAAPFTKEAVEKAREIKNKCLQKRLAISKTPKPSKAGQMTSNGHLDLRGLHQLYCIDSQGAQFYDDAISYNQKTGELWVHVVDVCSNLSDEMIEAARVRVQSDYMPGAPLHLMPPAALEGLSLSKDLPNECISVAFLLDSNGKVERCQFFLTIVDPIFPLKYEEANKLLKAGESETALNLREIIKKLVLNERTEGPKKLIAGVKRGAKGAMKIQEFQSTPAHRIIDVALDLYSSAAIEYCRENQRPPPIAQGGASVRGSGRFGTAPLRRYIDVLAQNQVLSILRKKPGLTKKKVIEEVSWIAWKRAQALKLKTASQNKLLLEQLAEHCSETTRTTGLPYAILEAAATGNGREVVLAAFGIKGQVKAPVPKEPARNAELSSSFIKGEKIQVRVTKVSTLLKQVIFEEAS